MSRVSRLVLLQMMLSSTTSLCDYQDLGCGKRWLSIWCRVHMKHKYHHVDYWTADGWNPAAFWGLAHHNEWDIYIYISYWSTGFCPSTVSFSFYSLPSDQHSWNWKNAGTTTCHIDMLINQWFFCGSESWMTSFSRKACDESGQSSHWSAYVRLQKWVDFRQKGLQSTNIAGWKSTKVLIIFINKDEDFPASYVSWSQRIILWILFKEMMDDGNHLQSLSRQQTQRLVCCLRNETRERKAEKGKMLNHQEFSIQDSWGVF